MTVGALIVQWTVIFAGTAKAQAVRMLCAFVLGFVARSAISIISDLSYRRRLERETKKWETIMPRQWRVTLTGIVWDDGKGEYDVSGLPHELDLTVEGDDEDEALQFALDEAGEITGFLIASVESSAVVLRRRR